MNTYTSRSSLRKIVATMVMIVVAHAFGELNIDSVFPPQGVVGEDLAVTLTGSGFDENTRVSISLDSGNRRKIVGELATDGYATGIAISGTIAYVAEGHVSANGTRTGVLKVVDIRDPTGLVIIGAVETLGAAVDVAISGTTAYVADEYHGLQVVDVSNPTHPVIIGDVEIFDFASGIAVSGTIACLLGRWDFSSGPSNLYIIDISDPTQPTVIGSVEIPGSAVDVSIAGNAVYVANQTNGLQIIDVSDPTQPVIITTVYTSGSANGIFVSGTTAYVAYSDSRFTGHSGLQAINVADPTRSIRLGSVDTPGNAVRVSIWGTTAYVADGQRGLQLIDVSDPTQPVLIGAIDTLGNARDVAITGTTAYVADWLGGLQVVDIDDPMGTVVVGSVESLGIARGIAVSDTIAYLVKDSSSTSRRGGAIELVDISVPTRPAMIGTIGTPDSVFAITISGTMAYVIEGQRTSFVGQDILYIFEISNPTQPYLTGVVAANGFIPDVAVSGAIAYVMERETFGFAVERLEIFDVSDPARPVVVGDIDTPGFFSRVAISGMTAFVAQAIDPTTGSLQVIDVSDPAQPQIVGAVETSGRPTDVAVAGAVAYVIVTSGVDTSLGGLRAVDVSDPATPVIVGSIDISGGAVAMSISGTTAYVADSQSGLQAIDISDPAHPVVIGCVGTLSNASDIAISTTSGYLSTYDGGLVIVPLPREIAPATTASTNTLRLTIPSPTIPGYYTLHVFSNDEDFELPGIVSFLPKPQFIVYSTGDSADDHPGDGICADGTGNCTLRAAVEEANAITGPDIIAFNIPGTGTHTIQPLTALPTITDPVTIDGYGQPGAGENTSPLARDSNAVVQIELDGSLAGQGAHGLHITGGESTVRGLSISRFGGDGIRLETGSGNVVEGNFIGLDEHGDPVLGNAGNGVTIDRSANNVIGGDIPRVCNIVAGNNGAGVAILGDEATRNRVQGNSIFGNAGLGLDLGTENGGDGATPNDSTDSDTGPNDRQNFPVITLAEIDSAGDLVVTYRVESHPDHSFYPLTIEFFKADSTASGQGTAFLGRDPFMASDFAVGSRVFRLVNSASLRVRHGDSIVATVTDAAGNSSEFSPAILAAWDRSILRIDSVSPTDSVLGRDLTVTLSGRGFDEATRAFVSLDSRNSRKIIGAVEILSSVEDIFVAENLAYLTAGYNGMYIIDIGDPAQPMIIGVVDTPGHAGAVFVSGTNAYVVESETGGLRVIDVSRPSRPVVIGGVDVPDDARDVAVSGTLAYVAADQSGLFVIDISNPARPVVIGSVDTPGYATDVFISGTTAYTRDEDSDFQIIDVSDPAQPRIMGVFQWFGGFIAGDMAYVYGGSGVQIVDIGNPLSPAVIGDIAVPGRVMSVSDTAVYIVSDAKLYIVDISDSAQPVVIGNIDTPGIETMFVSGTWAYITVRNWNSSTNRATGPNGLQVIDVTPPVQSATIGAVDTPNLAEAVAVTGAIACVADRNSGLQIIDVNDPTHPIIVGAVEISGSATEVAMVDMIACVAVGSGLQIIDVNHPTHPIIVGAVDTPGFALDVVISETTVYVADNHRGLQVVDISDPVQPTIIGNVDTPGSAGAVSLSGTMACIADGQSGLQVIDISDPSHPVLVGGTETPGWALGVWISESIAYVADGSSGLQVIDLSNPAQPVITGSADTPGIARDVFISGTMAYVADGVRGVQVIDISDPAAPFVVDSLAVPGNARNVFVSEAVAYVAAGEAGLVIVPTPQQIVPVTVIDETSISLTLPSPMIEGRYTLRVVNGTESFESPGIVSFNLLDHDEPGIMLNSGWNLISMPVAPDDASVENVFSTATGRSALASGNVWHWNASLFQVADHLIPGTGYWVNGTDSAFIPTTGTVPAPTAQTWAQGWNLVGVIGWNVVDKPADTEIMGQIWAWDSLGKQYYPVDSASLPIGRRGRLFPGNGYWLYLRTAKSIPLGP